MINLLTRTKYYYSDRCHYCGSTAAIIATAVVTATVTQLLLLRSATTVAWGKRRMCPSLQHLLQRQAQAAPGQFNGHMVSATGLRRCQGNSVLRLYRVR